MGILPVTDIDKGDSSNNSLVQNASQQLTWVPEDIRLLCICGLYSGVIFTHSLLLTHILSPLSSMNSSIWKFYSLLLPSLIHSLSLVTQSLIHSVIHSDSFIHSVTLTPLLNSPTSFIHLIYKLYQYLFFSLMSPLSFTLTDTYSYHFWLTHSLVLFHSLSLLPSLTYPPHLHIFTRTFLLVSVAFTVLIPDWNYNIFTKYFLWSAGSAAMFTSVGRS